MIIGIIHNNNNRIGGIENQIVSLINEISIKHKVFYFTQFPDSVVCYRFKSNNVKVVALRGGLINELGIIIATIKTAKIELLQIHTFDEGIKYRLVKLLVPRIKIVIRVHTYIACSWISNVKKKIYYFIDGISSFLVNKYIANGEYIKDELQLHALISQKKIISIIDGTRCIIENPTIKICGDDLNSPKMMMIANVIPHKGHNIMLESIKRLKELGIDAYCDVYGDYNRDLSYYNQLLKRIKEYGLSNNIHFKGFINNIFDVIMNYKIIILPSDSEGTPNCIMEGMSCKRLVIVSSTGAVSEMVEDGISGFVHNPCSVDSLTKVIIKLHNCNPNKIENICNNGYLMWKKNLNIHEMSNKFIMVYNNL